MVEGERIRSERQTAKEGFQRMRTTDDERPESLPPILFMKPVPRSSHKSPAAKLQSIFTPSHLTIGASLLLPVLLLG